MPCIASLIPLLVKVKNRPLIMEGMILVHGIFIGIATIFLHHTLVEELGHSHEYYIGNHFGLIICTFALYIPRIW